MVIPAQRTWERKDAEGKFYRKLRPQYKHVTMEGCFATPNGRILPSYQAWKELPPAECAPGLKLVDFGAVDPTEEPRPPEGMHVKVYQRCFTPGASGKLYGLKEAKLESPVKTAEQALDDLWLSEAEWKSLVPAEAKRGARFAVPESFADRLCRRYLCANNGWVEGNPWERNEVIQLHLTLTVEEASSAEVQFRLEGVAKFKRDRLFTYQLLGFLNYDTQKKRFGRFDVVGFAEDGYLHDRYGAWCWSPLGVAFELNPPPSPVKGK